MTGSCNSCGACCAKDGYVCENLIILTELNQPNGTKCAVYDYRYHGMPIRMKNKSGETVQDVCVPEYPTQGDTLLPSCSYKKK